MNRIITLALVGLMSLGGVAAADRGHDRGHHRGNAPTVRDHRSGGVSVQPSRRYVQPRAQYRPRYQYRQQPRYTSNVRVVHRPIYLRSRPVIRHRYYNYYQRPTLFVESPQPLAGYYWVNGSWQWNGAEWIWQPGHYEPDPNWGGEYYTPSSGSVYFYGSF